MAFGPHLRRAVDMRDLNPHGGGINDGGRGAVGGILRREREAAVGGVSGASVENMIVVQPSGEDRHLVQSLEDESVQIVVPVSGEFRFSPGQRVAVAVTLQGREIIAGPVAGERKKELRDTTSVSEVGEATYGAERRTKRAPLAGV